MIDIKPKTYKEVTILSRCLFARYYRYISDEEINTMYTHLIKNVFHTVQVTPKAIFLLDASGVIQKNIADETQENVVRKEFSEICIGTEVFSLDIQKRPQYRLGKKEKREEW